MMKKYDSPEIEVLQYRMSGGVFTSGPTDLHDGEDFDPDAEANPSGAKGYFAQD